MNDSILGPGTEAAIDTICDFFQERRDSGVATGKDETKLVIAAACGLFATTLATFMHIANQLERIADATAAQTAILAQMNNAQADEAEGGDVVN